MTSGFSILYFRQNRLQNVNLVFRLDSRMITAITNSGSGGLAPTSWLEAVQAVLQVPNIVRFVSRI